MLSAAELSSRLRELYPVLTYRGSFVVAASGTLGLLGLLVFDVWKAYQKRKPWVACNSLILSALSLTLLQIFNPSISKNESFDSFRRTCTLMQAGRTSVIGGRLALCAFVGYLLPGGVASRASWDQWRDNIALLLTVAIPLYQIIAEIYVLLATEFCEAGVVYPNLEGSDKRYAQVCRLLELGTLNDKMHDRVYPLPEPGTLIIVTDCVYFASILFLLGNVFTGRVACTSLQNMVDLRRPLVLNRLRMEIPIAELKPDWKWSQTRENLISLWLVGRTWQPAYLVARSVLSTTVALVVFFCCLLSIFELKVVGDISGTTLVCGDIYFGCGGRLIFWCNALFIAFAWIVISSRWVESSIYNPRFFSLFDFKKCSHFQSSDFDIWKFIRIEDFWLRGLQEVQEYHGFFQKDEEKTVQCVLTCLEKMAKAVAYILIVLQVVIVLFSKLCWLVSELLFPHQLMGIIFMGYHRFQRFSALYGADRSISSGTLSSFNINNLEEEFHRFSHNLLYLQGENPVGIWTSNLNSILLLESSMNEAIEKGKNSKELRRILQDAGADFNGWNDLAEEYLGMAAEDEVDIAGNVELRYNSLKMTAVSLLAVIIELACFYADVFPNSSETQQDIIESYTKACDQAWKIMELVESTKEEGSRVSKAADNVFKGLKQSKKGRHWLGHPLPNSRDRTAAGEDTENGREILKAAVENLQVIAKEEADGKQNSGDGGGLDTRNWNKVMAGRHLGRVCELLRLSGCERIDAIKFLKELQKALEAVMICSVWKVKESFNEKLSIWSRPCSLSEDEIWETCKIIALTVGVCATD